MLTPEEIRYAIDYEIIVDAYDDIEVSMGWYYTFDERLVFPFYANAQLKKKDKTIESKRVKMVGIHSKEEHFINKDFQLEMEESGYILPINYSQLSNIEADDETLEMFQIWDFWVTDY